MRELQQASFIWLTKYIIFNILVTPQGAVNGL